MIDGSKAFITNSGTPITSLVTVTARTDEREISAIVVPAGTPGLVVEPPYRKMGWHASDTHGLVLDGCRVPSDHLLGQRGIGLPSTSWPSSTTAASPSRPSPSGWPRPASTTRSSTPSSATPSAGRSGATRRVAFALADVAVAVENARTSPTRRRG